jgi:hypothetical protein
MYDMCQDYIINIEKIFVLAYILEVSVLDQLAPLPLAYDKTVLHGSDYVVEETTHIVAKT